MRNEDERAGARAQARRRALRAAQVVTLGLAMSGLAGCAQDHGTQDAAVGAVEMDGALDASADADLALDGAALADGGTCAGLEGEALFTCCEEEGWPCDFESGDVGRCAWGPYVPPAMHALPPSRAFDA